MNKYENLAIENGYKLIAGTDEVGRGCVAGPIVCAAVILPINYQNHEIKDSKQLTAQKREKLSHLILHDCLDYAIIELDASIVDSINPKQASICGMQQAIKKLKITPDFILIDYEKLNLPIPSLSITNGDQKSISIAAASIIAKVYRDKLMTELNKQYPNYGFEKNKGYLTKQHFVNLQKYGPIKKIHRFSFKPIKK